jgi:hypothetical protein
MASIAGSNRQRHSPLHIPIAEGNGDILLFVHLSGPAAGRKAASRPNAPPSAGSRPPTEARAVHAMPPWCSLDIPRYNKKQRGSQAPGTAGGMVPPTACPHAVRGACEPGPQNPNVLYSCQRFTAFLRRPAVKGRAGESTALGGWGVGLAIHRATSGSLGAETALGAAGQADSSALAVDSPGPVGRGGPRNPPIFFVCPPGRTFEVGGAAGSARRQTVAAATW